MKLTVMICSGVLCVPLFCYAQEKNIDAASFQVIQMKAQAKACNEKYPGVDLANSLKAWVDRNKEADEMAQKQPGFQQRVQDIAKNLVKSKRFTEQSCTELINYLSASKSDAK